VVGHDFNVSLLTMTDERNLANRLRERLGDTTEDRLGKALSELLENPLITGVIGRAFDAGEKASQAQEMAMGALNIPSAADIERLTRRLRSVSQRLEGIEDGIHKIDRALAPGAVEARLASIEEQLASVSQRLDTLLRAESNGTAAKRSPERSSAAKFTRRKRMPVSQLPTGAPSTDAPGASTPRAETPAQ
jgi:hypothetical protein